MILFDEIIFGPVLSRRLGVSLGINLLPVNCKICTFNCIYCECGWTQNVSHLQNVKHLVDFPSSQSVISLLEERLDEMQKEQAKIDSITFAGNGEPTMHPEFPSIIDRTINLRNKYYPKADITVLSNASLINNEIIINTLKKADKNMLKFDAGREETFQLLNKPKIKIKLAEIINNLMKFNGDLIIQSLFVKGEHNGIKIDNTAEGEVKEWLNSIIAINPKLVVIYSIAREPADKTVIKVLKPELESIAEKVKKAGLDVEIF